MKLLATLSLVGLAAFAAACADTPTDVSDLAVSGPAFTETGNGPPTESGIVTRDGRAIGIYFFANNAPLLQAVGVTMADLCSPEPDETDVVIRQRVYLPVEQRVLATNRGDVRVEVYSIPFTCGNYQEHLLVSGTAFMRYTNNDVGPPNGPNVKSYGYMFNGTLYGPEGEPYKYNAKFRMQYHGCVDPPGTCEPRRDLVRSIHLRPLPQ